MRHCSNRVIHQLALRFGDAINGLQGGIHRAVANAGILLHLGLAAVFFSKAYCGRGHGLVAGAHIQIIQCPGLRHGGDVAFDQCGKVIIINKFFLITDFLKLVENRTDFFGIHLEAEVFQAQGHCSTTAMLGKWQLGLAPAHVLGVHNFVGLTFFQDAVLMNPARMGKGIFSYNGLAALHSQPTHSGNQLGGFHDLLGFQSTGKSAVEILTGFEGHHHLFHGGVAGTLTNAINRALDLACACADCGQ